MWVNPSNPFFQCLKSNVIVNNNIIKNNRHTVFHTQQRHWIFGFGALDLLDFLIWLLTHQHQGTILTLPASLVLSRFPVHLASLVCRSFLKPPYAKTKMTKFTAALTLTLEQEGGWSDHTADAGGKTMMGVTLATFRRAFGHAKRASDLERIKPTEVATVYRQLYWEPCRCGDLPQPLALLVFDAAVNSGVRRSTLWLQQAVGAKKDGVIGRQTMRHLNKAYKEDPHHLIQTLATDRLYFLQHLSNWDVFGAGWSRRVLLVTCAALKAQDRC